MNTYSNQPGLTSEFLCDECPIGTFSNVTAATSISVCRHCPPGTFFVQDVTSDLIRDINVMCRNCKRGTWSHGDGICHLCDAGYWSDQERRVYPCHQICNPKFLCPVGSYHPKMFVIAQGNTFPVLDTKFWVFLFSCTSSTIVILLFRFC